jgi:hypothetical protein
VSTIDQDFNSLRNLIFKHGADEAMLNRVEALQLRVSEVMVERDQLLAERPIVLEYEERAREMARNLQEEFIDSIRAKLGGSSNPAAMHVLSAMKTFMVK